MEISSKMFDRVADFSVLPYNEKDILIPYGDMLQNYYSRFAEESRQKRNETFEKIITADDAAKEIEEAGKRVQAAFGNFPEDCPLETVSNGIIQKDDVAIEKVVIQTRHGIHATLLVYRKTGATDVQPGILLVCGHNDLGKAAAHYQHLACSLAMMGMTAVVIDPLGQGERKLYPELGFSSVAEHNLTGKQLWLAGEFFGLYRAYDAKRAVDYMVTRKDIDSARLGVAGVSGGGTLSSYTFALDKRIAAAAPSCYITTFMRNFDNELPTDSEQIPPGAWADGGEMIDLVISRAPAPCLVLSVENDYFDPRGTAESVSEAKKIYSLMGKEDNISMFVGPGSHHLPKELRDETCRFFARHFLGAQQDIDIPESKSYDVADILVLDGKMTHQLPGEKTITQHIAEKMDNLAELRKKTNPDIGKFLRSYLQIEENMPMPEYSSLRGNRKEPRVGMFGIKTETGARGVLTRTNVPESIFHLQEHDHAILYIGDTDSGLEMRQLDIAPDTVIYGLDVRGTGKSRSITCDHNVDFFAMYDSDYFYDSTGKLLNKPLLGGKARDVLAAVKLLKSHCRHLTVCGHGTGGVIAAYAAAADCRNIDELVLDGVPENWRSFVNGKDIRWPQSVMIPHSLKYFDMQELYQYISSQIPLKITRYADQMMK
jgi:cephalosporin-C deacetylase-like acetyl esterase